jgi:hypothetical protein
MENIYIQKVLNLCEPETKVLSEYVNAKTPLILQCKNGHLRHKTSNDIISRGRGTTCNECLGKSSNGKKLSSLVEMEFEREGLRLLEEYVGALIKHKAEHIVCGTILEVTPSSVTRGRPPLCPTCDIKPKKWDTTLFKDEISKLYNGLVVVGTYIGMKYLIEVENTICGHKYEVNAGHLLYEGVGRSCKVCASKTDTQARFTSILEYNNIKLLGEYSTTQTPVLVKYPCEHEHLVIPNNIVTSNSGTICRVCTPTTQISSYELEIREFIANNYSGWVEYSDRCILEGKELDVVLPDIGIAIEFNGSKWHSEEYKNSSYHINKTNMVEAFGYMLIHITEQEWLDSKNIVKSRLLHIIGCGSRTRYSARNLRVTQIPFPKEFLDNNHIQKAGSITKYNYGLFSGDAMIACMTFGKPRFSKAADYELIRYCTLVNSSIIGGASKLLSAFRKQYPGSILSYADRRWSQGNLYKTLGFTWVHNTPPNYKYYKYKYALSRYKCQKHLLKTLLPKYYDENLSEHQIMKNAGFFKVYDCGSSLWLLK